MRHSASIICLISFLAVSAPFAQPETPDTFATLYTGVATKNSYAELFKGELNAEDTFLVGLGLGRSLKQINPNLRLETEGTLMQYSGKQHNQEINLGIGPRWSGTLFNHSVKTSAAIHLGLSYALNKPELEYELNDGTSERLLAYLPVEITAAPADSNLEGVLHIHHRSTAFGTFGREGGINVFTLGLRKHF